MGLLFVGCDMVFFEGQLVGGSQLYYMVQFGVVMVLEGWWFFVGMLVEDNFKVVIDYVCKIVEKIWMLECIYKFFLILQEKCVVQVEKFLGGQQQMVVIGWVFFVQLWFLFCDEILFGFVLKIIREIYEVLLEIVKIGILIIIVEQDVMFVQCVFNCFYCMFEGYIMFESLLFDVICVDIV